MTCSGGHCSYYCYSYGCYNRWAYSVIGTVPDGVYPETDFGCVHDVTFPYTDADTGVNRAEGGYITQLRNAINQERNRRWGASWDNSWSHYLQYPALGQNYPFSANNNAGAAVQGDSGAQLGAIEELGLAISAWRSISYYPQKGTLIRAYDIDYIRIKVESMRKECLCHGDCGANAVCACYGDCGCYYCDERLKENIVYL